jgi:hypothetical protein
MAIHYFKITSKKNWHLNATQREQTVTTSNWRKGQTKNEQSVASWKNRVWMMILSIAKLHSWVITHKNFPSALKRESRNALESTFCT